MEIIVNWPQPLFVSLALSVFLSVYLSSCLSICLPVRPSLAHSFSFSTSFSYPWTLATVAIGVAIYLSLCRVCSVPIRFPLFGLLEFSFAFFFALDLYSLPHKFVPSKLLLYLALQERFSFGCCRILDPGSFLVGFESRILFWFLSNLWFGPLQIFDTKKDQTKTRIRASCVQLKAKLIFKRLWLKKGHETTI